MVLPKYVPVRKPYVVVTAVKPVEMQKKADCLFKAAGFFIG